MGVFSINTGYITEDIDLDEIEMNENYTTGTDMAIALVEARENEFAILQAGIKQDLVAAMCEDYDERLTINEATAGGVMAKVKEILKKLLEKLKGLFHSFMAKMNSFFMDSNEFYKKYSAEIAKKPLRDFEIKARKFDRTKFNGLIKKEIKLKSDIDNSGHYYDKHIDVSSDEKYEKETEKDKIGELVIGMIFEDKAIKEMSIDEDFGNVAKEIEDYVFEDAEKHDNLSGSTIVTSDWIGKLLSEKKFISDIEKVNKSSEKAIAAIIKRVDKELTKIAGTVGTDKEFRTDMHTATISQDVNKKSKVDSSDTMGPSNLISGPSSDAKSETAGKMMRTAAYTQTLFSAFQDCMIKAQNARLACAKKAVAQAKKIFAAAVAYNPKKEDYDFYTAVGEAAEFEAMMVME